MKINPLLTLLFVLVVSTSIAQKINKSTYSSTKWENLEIFQTTGVCGNNSWIPQGLAYYKYRIKAENLQYSYKIIPMK